MTQLSENFTLEEFSKDGPIDPACIPILTRLCVEVLEPVRAYLGCPLEITSGNRPPLDNAEAHGQPNSEHIYTPAWAAADFVFKAAEFSTRGAFDWMRQNSVLPFHQLILEHGQVSTVIHVSMNTRMPGVRSVLEGATHNAEPYVKIDHVDYVPPNNSPDVQQASAEG
jgi:peptidase M15-like protein